MQKNMINFTPNDDTQLIATLRLLNKDTDSAHLAMLTQFREYAICDGGDDDIAHLDTDLFLIAMLPHITDEDIETYDNSDDETQYDNLLPIYQRIKQTLI